MGLVFEEAGAELFANRTMLELTGLSGEQWPVDEYSPLVQGVELIGRRLGRPDILEWLLESRVETDTHLFYLDQLVGLGTEAKAVSAIMDSPRKNTDWLVFVKKILDGDLLGKGMLKINIREKEHVEASRRLDEFFHAESDRKFRENFDEMFQKAKERREAKKQAKATK